jgi:hypothetical protein
MRATETTASSWVLEHRAAGDVTRWRVHQKVAGAPQGKTRAPDDANWS